MTNRTRIGLFVALATLAFAVPAQAAQLDVVGGAITFDGEGAEANSVLFSDSAQTGGSAQSMIQFFDSGVASITITDAARNAGCKYDEEFDDFHTPGDPITRPNEVRCPVLQAIVANGGAGDDSLDVLELSGGPLPLPVTFNGGEGNDTLEGTSHADTLSGGAGDDAIRGEAGNDTIRGEAGNDKLTGMAGDDTLEGGEGDDELEALHINFSPSDLDGADSYAGGPGKDQISYFLLAGPVSVDLTRAGGDGRAGEGDSVNPDVEVVIGSSGNDSLIGDSGANELYGSDGNDSIQGAAGDDTLDGGDGDDQISGGAGDDEIEGDKDSDELHGGPGKDKVVGDGPCTSSCRPGLDTIDVRDGEADLVLCGGERDTVLADQLDNVNQTGGGENCETVSITRVEAGGGGSAGDTAVSVPRSLRLRSFLARGLPLTVACPGRCSVSAKASVDRRTQRKLRLRSRTVASGRRTLAGGSGRVTLKASRKAKRALKRLRRARLTIVVTVRDASGTSRGTIRTTIRR